MATTESDYLYLRSFIQSRSGNVLDASRDSLFESRLYRVLQERGMEGLDELVYKLRLAADPCLDRDVVEAMTINETSFFRDHAPFEQMQSDLLPRLIERRAPQRSLRLWSAASSSGQEAYSLAMVLLHQFPQLAGWEIEILGTDINAEMVSRAMTGRYQRMEINRGLPARYLLKYFRRDGEEWEVAPELRAICRFQQMNLSQSFRPFHKFDGILLRNVLFYFSAETQRQILRNMHTSLASDGFLLLGPAERPANLDLWHTVLGDRTCYYKPR